MNNKALIDALRLCLPLAIDRTDTLRLLAAKIPDAFADRAEAATHAVTAARLALADADEIKCETRYRVTMRCLFAAIWATNRVDVMADCADCADKKAREVCAAAGMIVGETIDVVSV